MGKKKYYLTLDTETATLPFVDSLVKNAKQKQQLAIAKPLVYDIGWIITDTKGNVLKKENFLIQETFFVPSVFNTAYYKEKRPIYIKALHNNEIFRATWNEAIEQLQEDLEFCNLTVAYNACFDFKKAIPFTERYIENLYGANFVDWEKYQRKSCEKILKGEDNSKNEKYLEPYFELRDKKYPIADLWGISCERLINGSRYKDYCLKNKLLTNSVLYFKTSAETSFQYLMKEHDFIEDHTALSDAIIESQILTKALKKGKVEPQIKPFPFRELGTTVNYALTKKNKVYKETIKEMLFEYLKENDGFTKGIEKGNAYWRNIVNCYFSVGGEEIA